LRAERQARGTPFERDRARAGSGNGSRDRGRAP